jgi:hypothetical protein
LQVSTFVVSSINSMAQSAKQEEQEQREQGRKLQAGTSSSSTR